MLKRGNNKGVSIKDNDLVVIEEVKVLLLEPDNDENLKKIKEKLGDPNQRPWAYNLAAGLYGHVGLLQFLIDNHPVSH